MFGKRQAKPADDAPAKQPAVAVPEPALEQPAATPEIVAEPATSSLDGDAQAEIAASNDDFGFDDSELFSDMDDSFDLSEEFSDEKSPATASEPEPVAKPAEVTKKAEPEPEPTAQPEPEPQKSVSESISSTRDDSLEEAKVGIFGALIESIDLTELSKLDPATMRTEISDIIGEIMS